MTNPGSKSDLVGVWVVDKPQGLTSFDVLRRLKRKTGPVRMGHAGTLDPMATGVLPVCLGEATRLLNYLKLEPKRYCGRLRLGLETDSWDITGRVIRQEASVAVAESELDDCRAELEGKQLLPPPFYSAVKYKGKPLYRYAREGKHIETAPREMVIESFDFHERNANEISFELVCSRGTYVRSVVQRLGERLGCGACLISLRRLSCGAFTSDLARSPEQMEEAIDSGRSGDFLIPVERLLSHLASVRLSVDGAKRVRHGNRLPGSTLDAETLHRGRAGEPVLLLADGRVIAVAEVRQGEGEAYVQPVRVFHRQ